MVTIQSRGDAECSVIKDDPAMTIVGLGIVGTNPSVNRISGFAGFREHDTYQITDAFHMSRQPQYEVWR